MRNIFSLKPVIKNRFIREWVEALLFALIIALIFRTWLFAPYRVPTGSMIHTIEVGDHLFVNKHAYGYVVPFTDKKLFKSPVQRNDIVVFPYPEDPSVNYIKRIIAVGGDELDIIGESVYVNGLVEEAPYLYFDENLISLPEHIKITIPEGKLWAMGDNRRNSKDSRSWGFVDVNEVIGKASVIYWSHNPNKSLINGYRFDRIGTVLK